MFSPRALVRGNPARIKFAAKNKYGQRTETVTQSGPWSGLGKLSPHGYYVVSLGDKPGIHVICFKLNLTMKININQSQNNRDLNQGVLPLWCTFGDPGFIGSQVTAQKTSSLTQTQGQIDASNNNTRRLKLALGKNEINLFFKSSAKFIIKMFYQHEIDHSKD